MSALRRSLVGLVVSRPVAMGVLLVAFLAVGAIAAYRLQVALVPNGWGESSVSVWVPFPEASPREVEEKAVRPIEEEMRTIPGVVSVSSRCRDSFAWIEIRFHGREDMASASADVRDRLERVRPRLPARIPRVGTWSFSLDDIPVVWCAFLFDERDERANWLVEEVVQKRIEAVDGVARVELWGLMDETVRIYLDEDRVRAHRLDLEEVVTRLARDNFSQPSGKVEEGGKRLLLRTDAKWRSVEEVRAIPVSPGVTLGDLGEVREERAVRQRLYRVNGRYAYYGAIYRESNANTVEVSGAIERAFTALESDPALPELKIRRFFDQGKMISSSLSGLGKTAWEGAILAVVVLFAFFRRMRVTLLVAAAIPASILAVLPLVYFSGDSFNLLTMMGITLAVGMLVDNAIVVVENILRLRELGRPWREAAVVGTREVALAVTLSTLTTVVVFAPLIFLSEDRNLRLAMGAIGWPLCAAVLASLAFAIYWLPTAIATFRQDRRSRVARVFARIPGAGKSFGLVRRVQIGVLEWCLRHRLVATLGTVALLASMVFPAKNLEKVSGDGEEAVECDFRLELPRNFTLQEASDEVAVFEEALRQKRDELGFKDLDASFDRTSARLSLYFEEPLSTEKRRDLNRRLPEMLPKRAGVRIRLDREAEGTEGRRRDGEIRIALVGRDSETLLGLGEEVRRRLAAAPGIEFAETALDRGNEEMLVQIDRDRMRERGIEAGAVRGTIEWSLRGFPLARLEEEGRERRLLVGFDPEGRDDLAHLKDLAVFSRSGEEVPLSAFATFSAGKSFPEIRRKDGKTRLVVTARVAERDAFRAWSTVAGALADMPFPEGYGWEEDGGSRDLDQTFAELGSTLNLSIVLVFLLMGVLFESAILPVSILLTIPLAAVGAFWALYLTKTALDPVGFIGLILLVGVVVNNGIVLIDRVNRLRREEGIERRAAVLQGSADRLRPVLMTALTTVLGLLPMALAKENPNQGISYKALAIAVAGGLTVSTIFTLWAVPLFYTLVEDLGSSTKRAVAWAFGPRWRPRVRLASRTAG